jgi:hypothetical protein
VVEADKPFAVLMPFFYTLGEMPKMPKLPKMPKMEIPKMPILLF